MNLRSGVERKHALCLRYLQQSGHPGGRSHQFARLGLTRIFLEVQGFTTTSEKSVKSPRLGQCSVSKLHVNANLTRTIKEPPPLLQYGRVDFRKHPQRSHAPVRRRNSIVEKIGT
jgi:hypothetical protein